MNAARSDAIVFYGATGDLAYKQDLPSAVRTSHNTIGSTSP